MKALVTASIAASVGFAVGRATAPIPKEERIDLREHRREPTPASDRVVDKTTAFVSVEVDSGSSEGKPAADQFCRSSGFGRAGDFTCARSGPCRAFDLIVCER